jgi:hypothetical protein
VPLPLYPIGNYETIREMIEMGKEVLELYTETKAVAL